jgi:hypothetical protein
VGPQAPTKPVRKTITKPNASTFFIGISSSQIELPFGTMTPLPDQRVVL